MRKFAGSTTSSQFVVKEVCQHVIPAEDQHAAQTVGDLYPTVTAKEHLHDQLAEGGIRQTLGRREA